MKHLLISILCVLLGFFTIYLMMSFYTLTWSINNMLPEHRFLMLFLGSMIGVAYTAVYNANKH